MKNNTGKPFRYHSSFFHIAGIFAAGMMILYHNVHYFVHAVVLYIIRQPMKDNSEKGVMLLIYVMSDLHGCYDKYMKMMDQLNLQKDDTLYVLGDVVDRGPDGIKILLDMYDRDNIIFLRGNHEQTAMKVLRCMFDSGAGFNDDELVPMIQLWMLDGGNTTLEQFIGIPAYDKKKVLTYLWHSVISAETEVNGKKYLLAHTVPEKEIMLGKDKCEPDDFILGEPDYDLRYYDDRIIVTGHTPTGLIEKAYQGRIYIKNNHIAVDCGAFFKDGRLGCICLDTMEEYYV